MMQIVVKRPRVRAIIVEVGVFVGFCVNFDPKDAPVGAIIVELGCFCWFLCCFCWYLCVLGVVLVVVYMQILMVFMCFMCVGGGASCGIYADFDGFGVI